MCQMSQLVEHTHVTRQAGELSSNRDGGHTALRQYEVRVSCAETCAYDTPGSRDVAAASWCSSEP
jgi:hypothetical protein